MVSRAWARPGAAVLVAGLCVAACSNSGKPSASSTTTTTLPAITRDTVVPTKVPNQPSVRKDVALLTCSQSGGGWSAGGAVHNTLGRTATFHITAFFTSTGYTDLAYATTSVTVEAGKSSLWSAKATFAAPSSVLCVLRGVSAS
jgi:hypothetical protein